MVRGPGCWPYVVDSAADHPPARALSIRKRQMLEAWLDFHRQTLLGDGATGL